MPALQKRSSELNSLMADENFWNNREKAQEVVARLKGLKAFVKPLEDTVRAAGDVAVMIEMAGEDESMAAEVPGEIERLEKALDDLETKSLLSGPLDPSPALVSINARDGGTDAHDWAEMLLRMYLAWARDHEYDTEILDRQDNEEAGINSAAPSPCTARAATRKGTDGAIAQAAEAVTNRPVPSR